MKICSNSTDFGYQQGTGKENKEKSDNRRTFNLLEHLRERNGIVTGKFLSESD